MGAFDGIKKIGKKIVGSIKKQFKKVMEVVGKFLNSKIGKIIMVAAAVVTGGMALYGAYAGMTAGASFAASQGASLMGQFVGGAKGFLAGALKGYAAAGKMMGNAMVGKFGEAGKAFTTLGSTAGEAGRIAAGGVADAAKNLAQSPMQELSSSAESGLPGGGNSSAQNMVQGVGQPGAAPQSGLSLNVGEAVPSAPTADAGSYTDQFKGMLEKGMEGYKSSGAGDTFLAKIKEAVASPEGLLTVGKLVSSGAKMWSASQAEEDKADEEKKAIRRGWTNDPRANVRVYNNGPGYA